MARVRLSRATKRVITSVFLGFALFVALWVRNKLVPGRSPGDVDIAERLGSVPELRLVNPDFRICYEVRNALDRRDPQVCRTDRDGNLYVVDIAQHQVVKFDSAGRFVKAWGRVGGGPGEFRGLMRLTMGPWGNVWVADAGNHRLVAFARSGTYLAMIDIPGFVINAVILSDSTIVVPTLFKRPFAHVYDFKGRRLRSWGEHLTASYLINQGRFVRDERDRMFYSYDFASPILVYGPDGTQLFEIDGPIRIAPPKEALRDVNFQLRSDLKFAALDLSVSDGKLYVLFSGMSSDHPLARRRVLEPTESDLVNVYDTANGRYLYSFRLPVYAKFFHVDRSWLYCVSYRPELRLIKYHFVVGQSRTR